MFPIDFEKARFEISGVARPTMFDVLNLNEGLLGVLVAIIEIGQADAKQVSDKLKTTIEDTCCYVATLLNLNYVRLVGKHQITPNVVCKRNGKEEYEEILRSLSL